MVEKRLARYNVVAEFTDAAAATDALEALTEAGLGPAELSLLGPEREKAPGEEAAADRPVVDGVTGVTSKAARGVTVGTLGGAGLGALAGAAATALPGVGVAVGAGALYAAVAGATMGSIPGVLLGAEAGARKSMMWSQTLQPLMDRVDTQGRVLVGVHSDTLSQVDRGEDELRDLEPLELHRLDADETFHPPGDTSALAGRSVPSGDAAQPGGELGRDQVDERDAKTLGMETRNGQDES